ncbi:MAG: hypothetical protein K2X69_11600 [Silvanigrellaceae bacterium]|nr:hypothetical protein [Silvanigrellaceae bacterium]
MKQNAEGNQITEYDDEGHLQCKFTLGSLGITNEYIKYYKNGTISQISHYSHGMLNGKTTNWDEKGALLYEMNFLENKLHGKFVAYANGKIHICMHYINGLLNGKYEIYSPFGKKIQVAQYLNNNLNGECLHYNEENGNITKKSNYLNGKLNGLSVTYYQNNVPMLEEYFIDDKLDGIVRNYFPNGVLRESSGYAEGNKLNSKEYDMAGNEIHKKPKAPKPFESSLGFIFNLLKAKKI